MVRLAYMSLLCSGLVACQEPSGPLLDQIRDQGELVVSTRNTATTYYIGAQSGTGFEYDLARLFANELGVNLRLVVADNFNEILPMLENGEAHLAAAGLTVTEDRLSRVHFGPEYQRTRPWLVYRKGNRKPEGFQDLNGTLEVVSNSSHAEFLASAKATFPDLDWKEDPDASSEELLARVWERDIDYTIAYSHEFDINQRYFPELRTAFELGEPLPMAWAFPRHADDSLYRAANAFFNRIKKNGTLDQLIERHYGHVGEFDYTGTRIFLTHIRSRLPQYLPWFIEGGREIGVDWRLLAAMGYQESHWNPKAVSHTGVRGIMMLTRKTVAQLGLDNRLDPEQSILGGARYFAIVKDKLPKRIEEPDRTWLALAAYNVGFGHLEDARRLTQAEGGDPDRWLDVKKYLRLLSKKKWYSRTRFGYARGWEPIRYVENVRSYYDILVWTTNREQAILPPMNGDAPTL